MYKRQDVNAARSSSRSDRWKAVTSACTTIGCMCADSAFIDSTRSGSLSPSVNGPHTSSRNSAVSSWAADRVCSTSTLRAARIVSCAIGTSSRATPSRSSPTSTRNPSPEAASTFIAVSRRTSVSDRLRPARFSSSSREASWAASGAQLDTIARWIARSCALRSSGSASR